MCSTSYSKSPLLTGIIEPDKCIIEDLEIIAFENEEELNYYTVWHEALVDKRRELNAETDRERQIIRNEITRKRRQLIGGSVGEDELSGVTATTNGVVTNKPTRASPPKRSTPQASPRKTSTSSTLLNSRLNARLLATSINRPQRPNQSATAQTGPQRQASTNLSASLPNGLTILNSTHFNTLPSSKQLMKYKLTKLYNKFLGRQMRRNIVIEKQRNAKIEAELGKCHINSWLAYTALQALRLPESNIQSLNTTTGNHRILTPAAQPTLPIPQTASTKKGKSSKKQQATLPQAPQPMHLVYVDRGNMITYSNRINPQQVAEYRRKSHLLPSSATSKKSSAASYDVYEIMEVLANTNKTNVTITRNANRPSQQGTNNTTGSIYSHSVNANTPGIVSTQLHLQARSYLDSMSKFYTEEFQRVHMEQEEIDRGFDVEQHVKRYIKVTDNIDQLKKIGREESKPTQVPQEELNNQINSDFEDELDLIEEDIFSMLKPNQDKIQSNELDVTMH